MNMMREWRRAQRAHAKATSSSAHPLASVPPGVRVYAVGDVHGRADLLQDVFEKIDWDRAASPAPRCFEIYLGDYIDRGPDTAGVISGLIKRQRRPDVTCLSGNHEALLLNFLSRPQVLFEWQYVGAPQTFASYGVSFPRQVSSMRDCERLAQQLRTSMPHDHLSFVRFLGLSLSVGDYFFVHAGIRPTVPLNSQTPEDMLWIRAEFLACEAPFQKVVVHGHTPVHHPDVRSNRINIDTAAYLTGNLTCLVLEGELQRFL
jgi:serine/threonine protein phosphatase 1